MHDETDRFVCPKCRAWPNCSAVATLSGRCTNTECGFRYPKLESTSIRVIATDPSAITDHDHAVDFANQASVDGWIATLTPGSPHWEEAVRIGMYARLHFGDPESALDRLMSRFLGSPSESIVRAVDLGCGPGGFALGLRRRFGCRVVGLDGWPLALRFADAASRAPVVYAPVLDAEHRLGVVALKGHAWLDGPSAGQVQWVGGDAHDPPFAPNQFDLAVAVSLFDSVSDPAVALTQTCALLRPGGLLLIAQPDAWTASVTERNKWMAADSAEWTSLMAAYGLEIVDRADGFEWTLHRGPRTQFHYVSHALLARRRSDSRV